MSLPGDPHDATNPAWLEALLPELRDVAAKLGSAHDLLARGHEVTYEAHRTAARQLAQLLRHAASSGAGIVLLRDEVSDVDLQLLSGLARGLPRKALPALVHKRRNFVDERLRDLMQTTGSISQFQFGVACTSRFWVPADPGAPRPPYAQG